MTKLETLAVELHDHMWSNVGTEWEGDWPLEIYGEDKTVTGFIKLMNKLQDEIVKRRAKSHPI